MPSRTAPALVSAARPARRSRPRRAHTYQNSQHRADAMKSWLHHYNWHRPHQGIGRAVPISRLNLDEYNLLTVHS
ncbi:hypothetical protein L548_1942 [Bordetella pertussis H921]|nr:hypothetical protein L548_1942 [Bordetella pertussis H921]